MLKIKLVDDAGKSLGARGFAAFDIDKTFESALGKDGVLVTLSVEQAQEVLKQLWRLLPAHSRPCP